MPDSANAAAVEVVPGDEVRGSIRPPGSKSLTNRALLCAAFAQGSSRLTGALRSEDTLVMTEALRKIGIDIQDSRAGRTLSVRRPTDWAPPTDSEATALYIANSGTTIRFLTAALSAAGGNYRLHGVPRMHARPIGDLIEALAPVQAGTIVAESERGCPPVVIDSTGWQDDGIAVAGNVSSQYLSGLMMSSPIADRKVTIQVTGELVSLPYVRMTADVMRSFGATVDIRGADDTNENVSIVIEKGGYTGRDYGIEPDASAASYFWAAAAITGGEVTVEGLNTTAMQGDVGFCDVLRQMGCSVSECDDSMTVIGGPLTGIDVDMNAISDTVQTLAVVALFARSPTRVRGVAHNRFKETDRIGDLACELRKLGAAVDEHEDGLTIHPPTSLKPATLETYHDHRMAMSLSLAGLKASGVRILNPSCTAKTYPEFFADLENLTGRAHRWTALETS
ncbi:MAG: 3-phosphoshikimate 1-carboxyvinyltransferase [Planctomycetota bacterium]